MWECALLMPVAHARCAARLRDCAKRNLQCRAAVHLDVMVMISKAARNQVSDPKEASSTARWRLKESCLGETSNTSIMTNGISTGCPTITAKYMTFFGDEQWRCASHKEKHGLPKREASSLKMCLSKREAGLSKKESVQQATKAILFHRLVCSQKGCSGQQVHVNWYATKSKLRKSL